MGDDPLSEVIARAIKGDNSGISSSAHGNLNLFLSNIGKPSLVILVVVVGLALGLSIGAVFFMAAESRSNAEANRRVTEQMRINERETRMTEYYINILNQTLAEQNIKFPSYLDFKNQHAEKE